MTQRTRLKYGALIDRLRKRAALAAEINEFGLEGDILDVCAALGELKEDDLGETSREDKQ